jgi:murein DD-endopeptidase MepM/ murein hydrolase activator NlpD
VSVDDTISPRKIISPIKIIARGDFAGSKIVKDVIKSNFYCDARKLGVPAGVVDSIVKNLSAKVDFRRALKKGDTFEIIYSPKNVMLYSKITTKHKQAAIYRVTDKSGVGAYYFDNGVKAAQKSNSNVFVPPLKGRLMVSSAFGARVHPIRRVRHMHTGVDLKAQYGTPVYAIFSGVVTRASRYEGYGHCIDIRHPSNFNSRYGHLSKYAVKCGMQVKKGQLIGYTGSSGTSTGPHLHLELARNNSLLNPLSIKMIPDEVQTVSNMKAFVNLKKQIEKITQTK